MENSKKNIFIKKFISFIFYWASFFMFSSFLISLLRRNVDIRNLSLLLGSLVLFFIFILIAKKTQNTRSICIRGIEFLTLQFALYNVFLGNLGMVIIIIVILYACKSEITGPIIYMRDYDDKDDDY